MSTWGWPVKNPRRYRYGPRFVSPETELWLEEYAEAAREQHRLLRKRRDALSPAVKALLLLAVLVFLFICTSMCWVVFQGIFLRSY